MSKVNDTTTKMQASENSWPISSRLALFAEILCTLTVIVCLLVCGWPSWIVEADTIALFATGRVLVVHLVAAIPMAWLVFLGLSSISRKSTGLGVLGTRMVVLAVSMSMLVLFLSLRPLPELSNRLLQNNAGFETRTLVRCLVATLLVMPFSLLIQSVMDELSQSRLTGWRLVGLTVIGVYLAAVYDWNCFAFSKQAYLATANSVRLSASLKSLRQSIEIHSGSFDLSGDLDGPQYRTMVARSPRKALRDLRERIDNLERALLSETDHSKRAMHLLSLGRFEQAKNELDIGFTGTSNETIVRAIIAREAKQWRDLLIFSTSLLAMSEFEGDPLPFQMQGEALVELGRLRDARACYEVALQSVTQGKVDFAMRLAKLEMDLGDIARAKEHLELAESLDASVVKETQRLRSLILSNSCRTRSWFGS